MITAVGIGVWDRRERERAETYITEFESGFCVVLCLGGELFSFLMLFLIIGMCHVSTAL